MGYTNTWKFDGNIIYFRQICFLLWKLPVYLPPTQLEPSSSGHHQRFHAVHWRPQKSGMHRWSQPRRQTHLYPAQSCSSTDASTWHRQLKQAQDRYISVNPMMDQQIMLLLVQLIWLEIVITNHYYLVAVLQLTSGNCADMKTCWNVKAKQT